MESMLENAERWIPLFQTGLATFSHYYAAAFTEEAVSGEERRSGSGTMYECIYMQGLAETCNIWQYSIMLDLNNPQTRQKALRERLDGGSPLIAVALAEELGISVDTVRRDLIALEQRGLVRRIRGGALPLTRPTPTYAQRAVIPDPNIIPLAERAVLMLPESATVFLDAGTTMNAIAARLPEDFSGLIVTPAPSVALAALNRGVRVHLIGGTLSNGAMATGGFAERAVADFAADMCFLGACGLWPDFGLSAEDALESGVKRVMALASTRVVVVASSVKLERRGRHRVLDLDEIDVLITDALSEDLTSFRNAGVEVLSA